MAAEWPRVNLLFSSQTLSDLGNFSLGLAAKAVALALGGSDEEDAMVDCVVSVEKGLRRRVGGIVHRRRKNEVHLIPGSRPSGKFCPLWTKSSLAFAG